MSFLTIPDINNVPILLQTSKIKFIKLTDNMTMLLNLGDGDVVETAMPREVLVSLLKTIDNTPATVKTHTEFAG